MSWDDWSDLDVSAKVADILGLAWYVSPGRFGSKCWLLGDTYKDCGIELPNYCQSWSDIGPLIDKHGILLSSTHCPAGSGLVYTADSNDRVHDAGWQPSYCRAAAIVFLMMNGVKSDGKK